MNIEKRKLQRKKYYDTHRDEILAKQKLYKEQHKEFTKEYGRAYRDAHREDHKRRFENYHLKRKYGISSEQRNEMIKVQDNKCAICGRPPTQGRKLHVDHDHKTNKIRKLLCFSCNAIIGLAKEDTDILYAVIKYLNQHKEKNKK